jgi:hypothetical protein
LLAVRSHKMAYAQEPQQFAIFRGLITPEIHED